MGGGATVISLSVKQQHNTPKETVLNCIGNISVTVTGRVGEKFLKQINFNFFSFFFMTVYSFAFDS